MTHFKFIMIHFDLSLILQVRTVPFTIRARITQSDLLFSSTHIDFGTCTIHESVVTHLDITNTSILPQEFGFTHLPEVYMCILFDITETVLIIEVFSYQGVLIILVNNFSTHFSIQCVDVQPNDGFGTLLPQETISVDVVFSASKPRDYCFELSCLTDVNRSVVSIVDVPPSEMRTPL